MVFKQGLLGIVKEGYGLREDCDIVLWIWYHEFGILFWLSLLEFDYCDWTKGKGLMLLIQIIVILKIVPLIW